MGGAAGGCTPGEERASEGTVVKEVVKMEKMLITGVASDELLYRC